jgi:hypothetical protein
MAGLVPAIHALAKEKTWMPGTRPGMTNERHQPLYTGSGCEKKLARM